MNEIHGRGEKTVTGRDAHRHRDLRSVPQQRIERFHLVSLRGVVHGPSALRIPRVHLRLALADEKFHHPDVPLLGGDVQRGASHDVTRSVHDGRVPAGVCTAVGCERCVDELGSQRDVARCDRILKRRRHRFVRHEFWPSAAGIREVACRTHAIVV